AVHASNEVVNPSPSSARETRLGIATRLTAPRARALLSVESVSNVNLPVLAPVPTSNSSALTLREEAWTRRVHTILPAPNRPAMPSASLRGADGTPSLPLASQSVPAGPTGSALQQPS